MADDTPIPKHKKYPRYASSDKTRKQESDEKRPRGRPKGSATVRSRKYIADLAENGVTPLHVMVNTMREIWGHALTIQEIEPRIAKKVEACTIAEKCARYIHPQLSAVQAEVTHHTDPADLPDEEILAVVARIRARERGDDEDSGPSESDPVH